MLVSAGTFQDRVGGHSERRRCGVAHGEGLHGIGAVAAGVGGGPETGDDLGPAATVADAVAVGDGDRAAGIRGCGDAIPGGADVRRALQNHVGEARLSIGGVVSRTVMVCTALVLLPHTSVAVQRRETTLAPPQMLLTLSL